MAKDYFAEEIENNVSVTGNILIDKQNIPQKDYFAEEIGDNQPVKTKTGISKIAEDVTNYVLPQWLTDAQFKPGEMNLLGDIANRPGAAIRSFLQGTGYKRGAINPERVPTFEKLTKEQYPIRNIADITTRLPLHMGAQVTDIITQPSNLLGLLLPFAPGAKHAGQEVGRNVGLMKNLVNETTGKIVTSPVGKMVTKGITNIQNIPKAIENIKNIPDKFFRGGLTKNEALRVEADYGSNNGSLVEIAKTKLKQAISYADDMYNKVFQKTPKNKFINIKPSIEEAGRRLKRLGLITENGNLTELGNSEITRDSVYGKLLDFYKSANAISGVEKLQGKSLTLGQLIKAFAADRETFVNKDQFLFLRDKLNSLYKNKPSDIDVRKVVDKFYQSGENSGLKGLQAARKLEKEVFYQEGKFLNRNTGDLKIATEAKLNRIGTDKPLSRQEMQHIQELQQYIKHPIISDAEKINKLNKAKEFIKKAKERTIWGGIGAIAGGAITKKVLRR